MKRSMYKDLNLAFEDIELSRNKTTLKEILKCIEKYNWIGGIGVSKIAEELDINPSTVTRNCKRLEEEWSLITRQNKQTPYHIAPEHYESPFLLSMIYEAKSKIWKSSVPIAMMKGKTITVQDKESNIPITITKNRKIILQNKFWDPKILESRPDDPQIQFLSFANEIGATIIYLFLEAIKPSSKIKFSRKERDQLIINWLRHVIDPWVILSKFCELPAVQQGQAVWTEPSYNEQARDAVIERIKGDSELSAEEKQKEIARANRDLESTKELYSKRRRASPDISKYELDGNNSKKLFKIYKEVFPLIFDKISKYAEELHEEYIEVLKRPKRST